MKITTSYRADATEVDKLAHKTTEQLASKYGLRDRAVNTFRAMADELLNAVAPAITEQAQAAADAAAKSRLKSILELPEASGRRATAERLATETDVTAEAAKSILAATPKQATGPSVLDQLMQARAPGISSDGGNYDDLSPDDQAAQAVLNSGRQAR